MTKVVAIDYEPFGEQWLIHQALRRWFFGLIVMAICGRRFGKTVLAINEIIARAIEIPNSRIWYVAPTKEQAHMIAWRVFFKYCPAEKIKRVVENRHFIELTNGSLIEFKGTQDEVFLLGVALHFVVLDEFHTMPFSVWFDVIRPMLADYNGDALFIGTLPDPRVHSITIDFLDMFEEGLRNVKSGRHKKQNCIVSFNFPSSVNPYINQERIKRDIADLIHKGRENDAKRLYFGKYTRAFGRAWPQFNYDAHTVEAFDIPDTWTKGMAVDPHPQKPINALWIAADKNNELWVYREEIFTDLAGRPLTVVESSAEMRAIEKNERIRFRVIDPTFAKIDQNVVGARSIKNTFADCGLYFIEAARTFHTFYDKFADMLVEEPHPTIHFFRSCPNVIRQVQNAVWASWSSSRAREERGTKDQIKKIDDDLLDCLKYLLNFGIRHIDQTRLDASKQHLADRWRQGDFM